MYLCGTIYCWWAHRPICKMSTFSFYFCAFKFIFPSPRHSESFLYTAFLILNFHVRISFAFFQTLGLLCKIFEIYLEHIETKIRILYRHGSNNVMMACWDTLTFKACNTTDFRSLISANRPKPFRLV